MSISEIIGKILGTLGLLLCLALTVWFIWSWYEVATNNLTPNYLYSDYNFFIVIFGRG